MVHLVGLLLGGHLLTPSIIQQHTRTALPAARRYFGMLKGLPGILNETLGREKGIKLATLLARKSTATTEVGAACLVSSLASALADTRFKHSLEAIRSDVLARSKRADVAEALDRKFWFVARGGEMALPDGEVALAEIIDAILAVRMVSFEYTDFGGKKKTVRVLPLTLALYEHQFYVISKKPNGDLRPYRFARIAKLKIGGKATYPSPGEYDPRRVLQNVFGIFIAQERPIADVRIRLAPRWRSYVERHRWHDSQRHAIDGDGRVVLHFKVRACPELIRWILGFGAEAEVLAPDTLRAEIAIAIADAAKIYAPTPQRSVRKARAEARPKRTKERSGIAR